MNQRLLKRLEKKARDLLDLTDPRSNKHFSFILHKRKVVSIGWNLSFHTHPIAKQYGYRFSSIHSELKAIQNFPYPPAMLSRCRIVNIRIMTNGTLGMSKPCKKCAKLIKDFNINEVWHTNRIGEFENET